MNRNTFAKKFRHVRDRMRTPQDSWTHRHGHLLTWSPFVFCIIKPLVECEPEDLMWVLLKAACHEHVTDIEIHFGVECTGDINQEVYRLITGLVDTGFTPTSGMMRIDSKGKGWINLPLFSTNEIPLSPTNDGYSA